ncbi:hypothetical protein [Halalkalibacter alkalisediminis]|uniref:Ricin B lectin domain-containing protein n=1 Tax=Halalkalibacter alkalisediminis TaxID=935616 RepID=A0ABV6NN97_9BACI|nr:hypothetical protein [Halalkalibacter alkalisediminis]
MNPVVGLDVSKGESAEAASASSSISSGQNMGNLSSSIYVGQGNVYSLMVVNQSNSSDVYLNVSRNGTVIYSTVPISRNQVWSQKYTSTNGGNYRIQLGCVSGTSCNAGATISN